MVSKGYAEVQVQSQEQVISAALLKSADRGANYPPSSQWHLGKDAHGRITDKIAEVVYGSPTFVMFEHIFGPAHLHNNPDEALDNYLRLQQALQLVWRYNNWGEYVFESKRDLFKLIMHLRELASKPHILSDALDYLS